MVICFEVGKTYRYKGKIGDPTPFTTIGINEHDAQLMVSGDPLVCTYVGEGPWRPMVGFRGMSHEDDGWAFTGLYDLFEEVEETTAEKDGQKEEKKEMPKFEVGKTYRYTGKIGDPTPFILIGIDEQDAQFIVSGKPLVCTYVEINPRPFVGFKGMRREYGGWAFVTLYHLFEEVKETTVAKEKQKEKQKEEKKETAKLEVGKTYRYTGLMDGAYFDFLRIGIDARDAEDIASGKPLTVELYEFPRRVKFKEFDHPWAFTDAMLNKFREVPAPTAEVDWEEKYTALKDKATEMLRILGDVAGDFKEEIESL